MIGRILGLAGDGADLVEASRIDEERNALAHCQPAARMLAFDLVGAAHFAREAFAAHELIEFGLPVHTLLPGPRRSSIALGSRDGLSVIASFA
jgi:hypothetical protein